MAKITAEMIKQLRERTGVGMAKCKEALDEAGGDMEKAISVLRKAGIASAVKKEGRETNEGIIQTSENDEQIAIVEINAETDFVVKNERFQQFSQNIAEEICASSPVTVEDFLKMPFSKNSQLTIDEYRSELVQSLGENIQVKRFEIFQKKKGVSLSLYSHLGGKLVTLVEIEGSEDVAALAKDIAMHVAAEAPEYLSEDEVPKRVQEHEMEIARAQIKNKPDHIADKIVQGKLESYFAQVCLLRQKFIKDPSLSIQQLVENRGKEIGNSLKLSYFLRWTIGG